MSESKRRISLLLLCVMVMTCVFLPFQSDASWGSVTSYEKVTWGISSGRYYVNGIQSFCAEYPKTSPPQGTQISSIMLCENDGVRKALYYGYNGPGNVLGMDDRAFILTSVAVSDANVGERETGVKATYDAFYWELVNNPDAYPSPPSNFKAYLAVPSSGSLQKLAFYVVEKPGYVRVVKTSADGTLTDGNSCYSLQGAEYGVYQDAATSEGMRVGTLITDANGSSNMLELPEGNYYIRETKAPKGYVKDDTVYPFSIVSEQTSTLQLKDAPQVKTIDLLLQKVDAQTGLDKPQGVGSLQGAQFTVKYYQGLWEKDVDPGSAGACPVRTWVFQTDQKGRIYMEDKYKVSGDDLYESLPLGTITIQEAKASKGYLVNDTVFVRQITTENTYQYPVVKEEKIPPYVLIVRKTDDYQNQLEGAEFTLYTEPECQKEVAKGVTDKEGILKIENLEVGRKYYLKETKAPAGYKVSQNSEEAYEIYVAQSPKDNEYHLEILNEVEIVLPKTGSVATSLVPLMGAGLCSISIYLNEKKRRNKT